jgi:hypothetical protein
MSLLELLYEEKMATWKFLKKKWWKNLLYIYLGEMSKKVKYFIFKEIMYNKNLI